MENINLNLDAQTLEHCLKSVYNFGHTRLINICNGTENIIPWGSVEWVIAIFFASLVFIMASMLAVLLWLVIFD